MKIKWSVSPAPTGPYKNFHYRSWPIGEDKETGEILVNLCCEDSYEPKCVKSANHKPIRVYFAIRKDKVVGFDWKTLKTHFNTLKEAKSAAEDFVKNNPEYFKNKEPD